jgi:hypothetical protein
LWYLPSCAIQQLYVVGDSISWGLFRTWE